MEFTFGIITDGTNDNFINQIIQSIYNNNIENYEIIIIGNSNISQNDKIKVIPFNENIKKAWITKKKNIIAENAKFENIVLLHDYFILENDWYSGFIKWGNNFDICVNRIKNFDGTRYIDYTIARDIMNNMPNYNNSCLLPYDFENNEISNEFIYISGAYYVIKKNIALKYKLNENLIWGQGEDYELALRLHEAKIIYKCNPFSTVKLLKYKGLPDSFNKELPMEMALKLKEGVFKRDASSIIQLIKDHINSNIQNMTTKENFTQFCSIYNDYIIIILLGLTIILVIYIYCSKC